MRQADFHRYWSRVDSSPGPHECWPWLRGRDKDGYGKFRADGRHQVASRLALELNIGRQLQPGEMACHACDNPPCCNPAHLFVGDAVVNTADRHAKGRDASGERSGRARLTEEAVRQIRELAGRVPQSELARRFGVSQAAISYAVRGVTWAGTST